MRRPPFRNAVNDTEAVMQKTDIRLYNILFPIWLFFLWPTAVWLLILPANFAVDSLVLYLAARHLKIGERPALWRRSIVKVWVIGFLSDLVGAALIFGLMLTLDYAMPSWDTFHFPGTTLLSLPGVVLAGVLIYWGNRRFSFSKCGLGEETVRALALALAVFTAPYAMLIPLYG